MTLLQKWKCKLLHIFFSEEYVLLYRVLLGDVKKVVLYGANSLCTRLICLLRKEYVEVVKVVDRQANHKTMKLQGIAVEAEIGNIENDVAVVICVLSAQKEVCEALRGTYSLITLDADR